MVQAFSVDFSGATKEPPILFSLFPFFRATYSPLWQLPSSLYDFDNNAPKDASENSKTNAVKFRVPPTCVFSVKRGFLLFFLFFKLVIFDQKFSSLFKIFFSEC